MEKRTRKAIVAREGNKSSAYKSKTKPPRYMVVVKMDGTEPEESFEDKGVVYERTDHIHIDLNSIPDHVAMIWPEQRLRLLKNFIRIRKIRPSFKNGLQTGKQRGFQNEDTVHKKRGCCSAGYSLVTLDEERQGGYLAYNQRKPGGRVWIAEAAIEEYLKRATHP
jgi:hypothetical protein